MSRWILLKKRADDLHYGRLTRYRRHDWPWMISRFLRGLMRYW